MRVLIKVSLSDVVNSSETFSKLMQQSFKGSLAFKIARLARELDKEMQTFNDERVKIAKKYGKKDDKGELIIGENGTVSFDDNVVEDVNNSVLASYQDKTTPQVIELPINAAVLKLSILKSIL